MQKIKQHPILFILLFYFVCFVFRTIEYLYIRTDQSIIGEAFIHKLLGIVLLVIAIRYLKYTKADIGFTSTGVIRNLLLGCGLAVLVFTVGYGVEMMISQNAALRFYATSYAVEGNRVMEGGALFVLICVVGNIINVVMEEGIFRGLFVKLSEEKHTFLFACLFSSILFGFWHIAQPLRNVIDGVQSVNGAVTMGLMLVGTSFLGGIQYVLLTKATGSLWAGMAAHFINNASANLLHVVTANGVDDLMTIRISIAQTLSFLIVLVYYLSKRRKDINVETQKPE